MITKIEARTAQGTLLTMSLGDVSTGIVVQDVGGLDPVKATLVSAGFAAMDGEQYQSSRREARNITMKLSLEPDFVVDTVRDLRKRLYGFFMPKTPVDLRFYMDDGLTVNISGRVETFDAPLFTAEPTVDLSIMCFDPDFVDVNSTNLSGSTVSSSADTHIDYQGTIETGFVFTLNVNRTLSEFTIYNRPADNILRTLDFQASMQAGDVVTISTIAGAKSVTLLRSGITSSVLYGMSPQSNWTEFFPGDNFLRVYATGAAVPYTVTYTPRYGGL